MIDRNRYHQKSVHFTILKLLGHMVSKYKEEENTSLKFDMSNSQQNTLMNNYTAKMSLVSDDWNGGVFSAELKTVS